MRLNELTNYEKVLGVALEIDLADFLRLIQAALHECGDLSGHDEREANAYYRVANLMDSCRVTANAILKGRE